MLKEIGIANGFINSLILRMIHYNNKLKVQDLKLSFTLINFKTCTKELLSV